MKTKNLFTFFLVTLFAGSSLSQCLEITCPGDTVFQAPNNSCEDIYNYNTPVGVNACVVQSDTFNFTGNEQSFTVPAGIDTLHVELYGAQGNSNAGGIEGGFGGYAEGKILVNSGQLLYIYVGDGGNLDPNGGYNGGGNAGTAPTPSSIAGGGGGASDIRMGGNTLTDRVIVAAGGAGAGGNRTVGGSRGTGGGGGAGYYGGGGGAGWATVGNLAQGGTQSNGGAGGISGDDPIYDGLPGSLGFGGDGGDQPTANQASNTTAIPGVGGGGLVGQNGNTAGTWTGGSGAGGSSYIDGVIDGSTQTGVRSGAGTVILKWYGEPATTTMVSGLSSGSVFPTGQTTTTYEVSDGGNVETCSFNVNVLPNIDTSVIVTGATLEAQNPNANYQWFDCTSNSLISGETSQVYEPIQNGVYAAIIDDNGCIDTSSCYEISTVGLHENVLSSSFSIYPNPTSSNITIDLNGSALTGSVLIYTADGKNIGNKSFENKTTVDLSIPGNAGVYFVQVYGNNFYYTERIVKQ